MSNFTFRQLCEQAEAPYLYHATFTKHVPGIVEKGLRQFEDSNWVEAGSGERYNEQAGIFAFEHPEDAFKWALKMEWEFQGEPISIVRIKTGDHWEQDPSQDINLQFGKGRSMQSLRNIPAEDIVDVFRVEDFGKPGTLGIGQEEWFDQVTQKLSS